MPRRVTQKATIDQLTDKITNLAYPQVTTNSQQPNGRFQCDRGFAKKFFHRVNTSVATKHNISLVGPRKRFLKLCCAHISNSLYEMIVNEPLPSTNQTNNPYSSVFFFQASILHMNRDNKFDKMEFNEQVHLK